MKYYIFTSLVFGILQAGAEQQRDNDGSCSKTLNFKVPIGQGLGMRLKVLDDEGVVLVQNVKRNRAAYKLGVQKGDVIKRIGGNPVDGMEIKQVTDLLKSTRGTNDGHVDIDFEDECEPPIATSEKIDDPEEKQESTPNQIDENKHVEAEASNDPSEPSPSHDSLEATQVEPLTDPNSGELHRDKTSEDSNLEKDVPEASVNREGPQETVPVSEEPPTEVDALESRNENSDPNSAIPDPSQVPAEEADGLELTNENPDEDIHDNIKLQDEDSRPPEGSIENETEEEEKEKEISIFDRLKSVRDSLAKEDDDINDEELSEEENDSEEGTDKEHDDKESIDSNSRETEEDPSQPANDLA
eukprot:CAMPEP_0203754594 /NCGR_PEP_ID=MMETSP0098-20131031/8185_1 /ASSEMBLY_ACC=CAM_ASM_000208 /TAXON_ID=96639 /ORGANISM=" , Strain NY0313808BC1" /LENGTH=356 /DNA_ID=CAMNT_0050645691 /DNA_START=269 /DNA_END=1336 /DNA_ORIENTATION=-